MKTALLILLLPLACLAQHPLVTGAGIDWTMATSVPGPSSIPGMQYDWVGADGIGGGGQWIDRHFSAVWTNGDAGTRPIQSGNAISFSGSAQLTNNVLSYVFTTKTTFFIVVKFLRDNNNFDAFFNAGVGGSGSPGFMIGKFTTPPSIFDNQTGTPKWIAGTNYVHDWIAAGTSALTDTHSYTNNVSTGWNTALMTSGTTLMQGLAAPPAGGTRGVFLVYEFVTYTNVDLTAGNRATLHTYAQSVYGVTP